MMAGISSLIFIPLLMVFFAHMMWAFGGTWPADDEKTLARTVVGARDITQMPPRWMSALVALLIITAGMWALFLSDPTPNLVLTLGGAALTLIFVGRGIAAYTKPWRAIVPEEPFATFDKKVYGPLCLWVGLGFAILTIWRLL